MKTIHSNFRADKIANCVRRAQKIFDLAAIGYDCTDQDITDPTDINSTEAIEIEAASEALAAATGEELAGHDPSKFNQRCAAALTKRGLLA